MSSAASNTTRQAIVQAYLQLLAEKPFSKVSVKEVAELSRISRTAFYRYFDDTFDLLESVERDLLEKLSLYKAEPSADVGPGADELAGKPFESMRRWFETGIALRDQLRPIMGRFGDVYFRVRLSAQVRKELNTMMDDDRAPRDKLRPYYVELLTAAYVGMLAHVASVENDDELISAMEMAEISNSVREAYYRLNDTAPSITDEKLYGRTS